MSNCQLMFEKTALKLLVNNHKGLQKKISGNTLCLFAVFSSKSLFSRKARLTWCYFTIVTVSLTLPTGSSLRLQTKETERVATNTSHVFTPILVFNDCPTTWTSPHRRSSYAFNLFLRTILEDTDAFVATIAAGVSTSSSSFTNPLVRTGPTKFIRLSFFLGAVRAFHLVAACVRAKSPNITTGTLHPASCFVQVVF